MQVTKDQLENHPIMRETAPRFRFVVGCLDPFSFVVLLPCLAILRHAILSFIAADLNH